MFQNWEKEIKKNQIHDAIWKWYHNSTRRIMTKKIMQN